MKSNPGDTFRVGSAKVDMTYFHPGIAMLGWGDFNNKAYGVESPLHARVFVIQEGESGRKLVWVSAEICFITQLLKQEVSCRLQEQHPELGISDQNLMLTATHTHSAPGGFSHSPIYNLPNTGLIPEVLETFVESIVRAIVKAHAQVKPARIHFGSSPFPPEVPVVFNRSWQAYNRNPEIEEPVTAKTAHLAADRNMYLMRFEGVKGEKIGAISWFGVHATCIKRHHEVVSSDNKGYASTSMENAVQKRLPESEQEFVAAFAQTTAGDMSPNYVKHVGILEVTGPTRDDFKNRTINGELQKSHAMDLFGQVIERAPLSGSLDCLLHYVDMSHVEVDSEFSGGEKDARTGEAIFGTRFIIGTREGRGAPRPLGWLATWVAWLRRRRNRKVHGRKYFLIETVSKRWMGFRNLHKFPLPAWIHPMWKVVKELGTHPALEKEPLVPQIMPVQIFLIGEVAIVAIPAEPTTIAGLRMRKTIAPILEKRGVREMIIGGYANAYTGYVTTREEYALQRYEGSHTLFGQWTCAAYQTALKRLAGELLKRPEDRDREPMKPPARIRPEDLIIHKFGFYRWKLRTFARTRKTLRSIRKSARS